MEFRAVTEVAFAWKCVKNTYLSGLPSLTYHPGLSGARNGAWVSPQRSGVSDRYGEKLPTGSIRVP